MKKGAQGPEPPRLFDEGRCCQAAPPRDRAATPVRAPSSAPEGRHSYETASLVSGAAGVSESQLDSALASFGYEITGAPEKIDAFAELMRPLGLLEVARTGVAALSRDGAA